MCRFFLLASPSHAHSCWQSQRSELILHRVFQRKAIKLWLWRELCYVWRLVRKVRRLVRKMRRWKLMAGL